MEEIDYKRSIELLNRDVDACLEIIERWKKNSAYLVSIGVMPPDQWGVPLVEKLVPFVGTQAGTVAISLGNIIVANCVI